ncbi:RNA polymerase sigma factor [Achromobacter aegrifaciens]
MSHPPSSLKAWLAHYGELVGAWAKRNSRPSDAEDAAQDVMAGLLSGGNSGVVNGKSYLRRAAQNRLISEIRRQARQAEVSLEAWAADDPAQWHDPESSVRARQLADALECALASLPLKKRQAYVWCRLEGYSQPEAAARMGLALNTVERYIMDATREVREQLKHFCPD